MEPVVESAMQTPPRVPQNPIKDACDVGCGTSDLGSSQKKKNRYRPALVVNKPKPRTQREALQVLDKLQVQRLIRKILGSMPLDIELQSGAFKALIQAANNYVVDLLQDTDFCRIQQEKKTIMEKDIEIAKRIRGVRPSAAELTTESSEPEKKPSTIRA